MIFPTKLILCLGLFLFLGITPLLAQEENEDVSKESENDTKIPRQRIGNVSSDYYIPISTGNKYIGKGLSGKHGFNFRTQAYIYKQIFVGFNGGQTYFDVEKPELVGNYERTSASNYYFFVGYEFLPLKDFRVGLSVSLFGESQYKNTHYTYTSFNAQKAYQVDNGRINAYEAYIDYELNRYLAVYVKYSYRNDRMKIDAPAELESFFDRAQFHTIGIGIKCLFGNSNIFGN